jgi:hypothetical protein
VTTLIELKPFLAVLDRIIKLLGIRVENKRLLFKDIVEPLFHELEPLVDDYILLFRQSYQKVKNSNHFELPIAVKEIREHRENLSHVRSKTVELAKIISENYKEKKVQDFAKQISKFFHASWIDIPRKGSRSRILIELCDYVLEDKMSKGTLLEYIDITNKTLEIEWIRIVQTYGILKLHCLK